MSNRSFRRAHARRVEREARRARQLARRGRLLVGTTVTATALMTASAQAAAYVVNTTADDASGGTCQPSPGVCTLRDAISSANKDSSADTITFDPSVTGTITLTNGALYLNNRYGVDIQGPGSGTLTVSGGNNSQIFTFSNAAPANSSARDTISGLTMTDGNNSSGNGGAIGDDHSNSSSPPSLLLPLSLKNDVISNSQSSAYGGGIETSAPLTLSHTTVTGNTASRGGGIAALPVDEAFGKYGNLVTVDHSVIGHNHATVSSGGFSRYPGGGGILSAGDALFVRNSAITGNTSGSSGAGIAQASKYGLTVSHSTITGNRSASLGGGVEVYGLAIRTGPTTRENFAKYSPTEIQTTTISGNHAVGGAGIHVDALSPGSPMTVQASTISGNHGGTGSFGGGIDVSGNLEAPFRLVDSTVAGNGATNGGGISLGDPFGYPLTRVDPANGKRGSVSLDNSTIAGNRATSQGGGIYLDQYTPSGASSPRSGTAKLVSTIVAGNYAAKKPNDLARASGSTAGGFVAAFSLIQTPGSAPLTHNDPIITGKAAKLGPLANNGGPTRTKLPAKNSPAIDQGHNSLGLAGDQRGAPRRVQLSAPNPPGGDGTDIGAVELQGAAAATANAVSAGVQGFAATVNGTRLGGSSTPQLVIGRTPVTCRVRVGQLASCQVEVRVDGYLVAAGGRPASHATNRLSTTVRSRSVVQRYLKKHYPHGVNAQAYVITAGDQLVAIVGQVHLVAGR